MPEKKNAALRRRIAPYTPLKLLLEEPDGNIQIDLKLAFNMNAGAAVQEKTRTEKRPEGLMLTDATIWGHIAEPTVFRAMLWAAALAHQPEYDTDDDEGLETIGSYIQENVAGEISEALWKAYLAFLPPGKRELLAKVKDEADKRRGRGGETESPLDETKTAESEANRSAGSSSGPSADTISGSALANSAS